MHITRNREGRELIVTGAVKISDYIQLLETVKREHGDIPLAIPRCPTKVVMGKDAYIEGYGKDLRFSSDQISTTLESIGPEIEW